MTGYRGELLRAVRHEPSGVTDGAATRIGQSLFDLFRRLQGDWLVLLDFEGAFALLFGWSERVKSTLRLLLAAATPHWPQGCVAANPPQESDAQSGVPD